MKLKRLIIPVIGVALLTNVTTELNASEVEVSNAPTVESQPSSSVYAPAHPTNEQVEAAAATDLVTFNDTNLEQAVSTSIGIPVGEITVEDMERLYHLTSTYNEINDLTGLEYATNLKGLSLQANNVSDLSPLSGLTSLTELDLSYNNVSDITPVVGLTSLTELDLSSNNVSDITPVAGLTSLTELRLSSNNISDLSPLSGLTSLTFLRLISNNISDITPLTGLTNLDYLALSTNNISDIAPIAGLTNLTVLGLSTNNISDLSPLSGLTNLTDLALSTNNISDIAPIAGLTSLTELRLSTNNISDLSPLSGLTNLTYLTLSTNNISDLSPLSGLTNLTDLTLSTNNISDLSPLSGLTNLEYIELENQKVVLDNITVNNSNQIFYTLTNADGSTEDVSLGNPINGTHTMNGDWNYNTMVGSEKTEFSGFVSQTVTYDAPSTLTGIDNASTTEETELTDEQLISLFEVVSSTDDIITVDQSAVDYSTPDEYQVIFTDTYDNEFIGILTVTDVLPTLTIDHDTVTLSINGNLDDILSGLVYSATEITDGDLTNSITIDDSAVDYSTPGSYELIFTVTDEDGNNVTKTVTVVIEDNEIVAPETPDEVTSEDSTDEVTSEDSTDEITSEDSTDEVTSEDSTDEVTPMSLATTGGKIMRTLIILLAIVIAALGLKRFIKA